MSFLSDLYDEINKAGTSDPNKGLLSNFSSQMGRSLTFGARLASAGVQGLATGVAATVAKPFFPEKNINPVYEASKVASNIIKGNDFVTEAPVRTLTSAASGLSLGAIKQPEATYKPANTAEKVVGTAGEAAGSFMGQLPWLMTGEGLLKSGIEKGVTKLAPTWSAKAAEPIVSILSKGKASKVFTPFNKLPAGTTISAMTRGAKVADKAALPVMFGIMGQLKSYDSPEARFKGLVSDLTTGAMFKYFGEMGKPVARTALTGVATLTSHLLEPITRAQRGEKVDWSEELAKALPATAFFTIGAWGKGARKMPQSEWLQKRAKEVAPDYFGRELPKGEVNINKYYDVVKEGLINGGTKKIAEPAGSISYIKPGEQSSLSTKELSAWQKDAITAVEIMRQSALGKAKTGTADVKGLISEVGDTLKTGVKSTVDSTKNAFTPLKFASENASAGESKAPVYSRELDRGILKSEPSFETPVPTGSKEPTFYEKKQSIKQAAAKPTVVPTFDSVNDYLKNWEKNTSAQTSLEPSITPPAGTADKVAGASTTTGTEPVMSTPIETYTVANEVSKDLNKPVSPKAAQEAAQAAQALETGRSSYAGEPLIDTYGLSDAQEVDSIINRMAKGEDIANISSSDMPADFLAPTKTPVASSMEPALTTPTEPVKTPNSLVPIKTWDKGFTELVKAKDTPESFEVLLQTVDEPPSKKGPGISTGVKGKSVQAVIKDKATGNTVATTYLPNKEVERLGLHLTPDFSTTVDLTKITPFTDGTGVSISYNPNSISQVPAPTISEPTGISADRVAGEGTSEPAISVPDANLVEVLSTPMSEYDSMISGMSDENLRSMKDMPGLSEVLRSKMNDAYNKRVVTEAPIVPSHDLSTSSVKRTLEERKALTPSDINSIIDSFKNNEKFTKDLQESIYTSFIENNSADQYGENIYSLLGPAEATIQRLYKTYSEELRYPKVSDYFEKIAEEGQKNLELDRSKIPETFFVTKRVDVFDDNVAPQIGVITQELEKAATRAHLPEPVVETLYNRDGRIPDTLLINGKKYSTQEVLLELKNLREAAGTGPDTELIRKFLFGEKDGLNAINLKDLSLDEIQNLAFEESLRQDGEVALNREKLLSPSKVSKLPEGKPIVPPQNNTPIKGWARTSPNGYEVSSRGDKTYSAFNAKLSDGRSIEQAYQEAKGTGKGQPAKDPNFDYWGTYKGLWNQWASENPQLIQELKTKSAGKVLTDQFASTENNQARALSEIIGNSPIVPPQNVIEKAPTSIPKAEYVPSLNVSEAAALEQVKKLERGLNKTKAKAPDKFEARKIEFVQLAKQKVEIASKIAALYSESGTKTSPERRQEVKNEIKALKAQAEDIALRVSQLPEFLKLKEFRGRFKALTSFEGLDPKSKDTEVQKRIKIRKFLDLKKEGDLNIRDTEKTEGVDYEGGKSYGPVRVEPSKLIEIEKSILDMKDGDEYPLQDQLTEAGYDPALTIPGIKSDLLNGMGVEEAIINNVGEENLYDFVKKATYDKSDSAPNFFKLPTFNDSKIWTKFAGKAGKAGAEQLDTPIYTGTKEAGKASSGKAPTESNQTIKTTGELNNEMLTLLTQLPFGPKLTAKLKPDAKGTSPYLGHFVSKPKDMMNGTVLKGNQKIKVTREEANPLMFNTDPNYKTKDRHPTEITSNTEDIIGKDLGSSFASKTIADARMKAIAIANEKTGKPTFLRIADASPEANLRALKIIDENNKGRKIEDQVIPEVDLRNKTTSQIDEIATGILKSGKPFFGRFFLDFNPGLLFHATVSDLSGNKLPENRKLQGLINATASYGFETDPKKYRSEDEVKRVLGIGNGGMPSDNMYFIGEKRVMEKGEDGKVAEATAVDLLNHIAWNFQRGNGSKDTVFLPIDMKNYDSRYFIEKLGKALHEAETNKKGRSINGEHEIDIKLVNLGVPESQVNTFIKGLNDQLDSFSNGQYGKRVAFKIEKIPTLNKAKSLIKDLGETATGTFGRFATGVNDKMLGLFNDIEHKRIQKHVDKEYNVPETIKDSSEKETEQDFTPGLGEKITPLVGKIYKLNPITKVVAADSLQTTLTNKPPISEIKLSPAQEARNAEILRRAMRLNGSDLSPDEISQEINDIQDELKKGYQSNSESGSKMINKNYNGANLAALLALLIPSFFKKSEDEKKK